MKNITLGKYIPLNSPIHNLDPRSKIIAMLVLLVCVFIPCGWIGHAVLAVILVTCVLIAKLNFDFIWKSFKPMIFMLVFLTVVNVFVIKTGTLWLTIGKVEIYSGAFEQSGYVIVRLLLMIITTTLLTATTKPLDMTLGIEELLTPLAKINFPTHDVAMMISLALRFIPTLLEEANRILKAQASRGVDIENGSFKDKIQAILALIIPLFVSCFQKADDLADAMEARGYVVGAQRVRYKQLSMKWFDYLIIVLVNILLAGCIWLSIWTK